MNTALKDVPVLPVAHEIALEVGVLPHSEALAALVADAQIVKQTEGGTEEEGGLLAVPSSVPLTVREF